MDRHIGWSAVSEQKKSKKTIQYSPEAKAIFDEPQGGYLKVSAFYVTEQDSWRQVLRLARENAALDGPADITFAHSHMFGDSCKKNCKTVTQEDLQ